MEGEWRWVQDCAGLNGWQYFNWKPGTPDDIAGYQDCAEITPAGEWNDQLCDIMLPYVCEIMEKSKPVLSHHPTFCIFTS